MAAVNVVDIGGLLNGGRRVVEVRQEVVLEPFDGWSFPSAATVQLEIRAVARLVDITGVIDVEAAGQCDRCLREISTAMHVDVREQFEAAATFQDDPFDEGNVLRGERLDVADLSRQLVDSAVPFAVLCDPNCRGLCANCGQDKNQGECACVKLEPME